MFAKLLDEQVPVDAAVLEVGCGTGQLSNFLAMTSGRRVIAADLCMNSLRLGADFARRHAIRHVAFCQVNLFRPAVLPERFDVVICQGVLHHTSDPIRGLNELMRVCRPGGLVSIFVYNKWNHWRHNLQKSKVSRLAGPDFERRFDVAHELYGQKSVEEMSPEEIATFYDQYCHPHKSDHTVGEVLRWFDDLGLQYWGSYPALRFRDFIAAGQFRGRLLEEYPIMYSRLGRAIVRQSMRFPAMEVRKPPFKRPTLLHQILFQLGYAWQGRHGEYSGGAGLAGRKPIR